jgi:hypothetical protein
VSSGKVLSEVSPVKEQRVALWLPMAAIALTSPFFVWFAIGDLSFGGRGSPGLSHEVGPYQVGPESGFVVGGVAALVAAAAVGVLVIRTRQGVAALRTWAVTATLVAAGALGAAAWRVLTAGVVGTSIGGGVVLFAAPLLLAGLLVGAVWLSFGGAHGRLRRAWLLTAGAVLVAPALYAVLFALSGYDASAGLITAQQHAEVRVGQTRSEVHAVLGREGRDDFAALGFPPVAPGMLCDYYVEVDAGGARLPEAYRFCFRAGVLVSKDVSAGQP